MIKILKEKNDLIFIIFFLLILAFNLYNSIFLDFFVGAEMANKVFEIGKHEYEVMYILKPIINKNLSLLNLLIINIYFLSITYLGNSIIKLISKYILRLKEIIDNNKEFFFISSFVVGSIIFNGFIRLLSLNVSITTLNFFIIIFLITCIYFFFNSILLSWKKYLNFKSLIITIVFFILFINNLQIDGHHISGDSSYHYGYKNLLINFFKLDLIPIVGGHYFETLIITPITFILQDFFFFNTFEESVFLSNWFFQTYAKTASFFLIYLICIFFFKNSKIIIPLIFTFFLFFTNYSGSFFINPLLYDSGNPLALSLHGSRVIGITSFIFISVFIFEFINQNINNLINLKNKILIYFFIILYLAGLNSLGVQFIFLNLLFISFFLIFSIKKIFLKLNYLNIPWEIFILVFLIAIFLSYTIIGRNFYITNFSAYIMIFVSLVAGFAYYTLPLKFAFNSVDNKITIFSLFILILNLIFIGNFFTYFFLFNNSSNNFELLSHINNYFSTISIMNSKINEIGLYNDLINYDKTNDFMIMNICSFKDKIKLFMTGMPNYHCISLTRLIYGSGFIFLIFVYNSFKILNLIGSFKNSTLDHNYKISIYFYFLSAFFYIFSLTYVDMLSGSYMLHSRTRFLEVANILILFNFVMLFSINFNLQNLYKKIIVFLILFKFLLPFSINFNIFKNYIHQAPIYDIPHSDYNNWYINQWKKNFKYIFENI